MKKFFISIFAALFSLFVFGSCGESVCDSIDRAEWESVEFKKIHVYYDTYSFRNIPENPAIEVTVYKADGTVDKYNYEEDFYYNPFVHRYSIVTLKQSVEAGGFVDIRPSRNNDSLVGFARIVRPE